MKNKLDRSVNHRIAMAAGLLKRQIFRVISASNIDITPEQWVVLNYLWEKDGLTIGELVEKSKKDFANVTRIVDKLQRRGYIRKSKSKKDGRSYIVCLADKAVVIRPGIEECWIRSLDISLRDITDEEQVALLRTLEKIEGNILNYLNE